MFAYIHAKLDFRYDTDNAWLHFVLLLFLCFSSHKTVQIVSTAQLNTDPTKLFVINYNIKSNWDTVCAQVLAVGFQSDFYLPLKRNHIFQNLLHDPPLSCALYVCSSRKSASRLICRIASSTITTRAPHSVSTVAVYYGVSTDRALSVTVSTMSSFVLLYLDFLKC